MTLPSAALLLAQTFVVDASGGGDFTTLQAAIDAAQAGDILLVQPGTYAPFVLAKELQLLGPAAGPRPEVIGHSQIQGVPGFVLAGLELERLSISDVSTFGHLDQCRVVGGGPIALDLDGVQGLLIERSQIESGPALFTQGLTAGLRAVDCELVVVGSNLIGGDSVVHPVEYAEGGTGAWLVNSDTWIVQTDLRGGGGGFFQSLFSFCENGGDGLTASGGRTVLRGSGSTALGGGGPLSCADGASVRVGLGGELAQGGYALPQGLVTTGAGTVVATSDAPTLTLVGSDLPGAQRRLRYGAAEGTVGFVFAALGAEPLSLAGLEGAVWLAPSSLFLFTTLVGDGLASPATVLIANPPSTVGLEGLGVPLQALVPTVPGAFDPAALTLTNPVRYVLRF
jgi:hypothetical protein